jgi:hypothetical protein
MAYLIGTDEAGYGPNLGPLVISATVWEVSDGITADDLFERLRHVITQKKGQKKGDITDYPGTGILRPCNISDVPFFRRVVMADSKKLYAAGKGLQRLERGLWAAMGLFGHCPRTWRDVWRALAPETLDSMPEVPWYAEHDGPAPSECNLSEIESLAGPLREGMAAAGVRLVAVRSRAVFAHQFNDLVDRHGSKGAVLSHQTLDLAAAMIAPLPETPISLICDKHGGRNRYRDLLEGHFPEWFIEVHGEGRRQSVYRLGPPDRRVEVCFRVKAEDCLPAALASMASKYLRELAMQAFNRFWGRHVPGLLPTAGYPQDAKRFRADVAEIQHRMHISDRLLWRSR